jgi:hypothetical protein
LWKVGALPATVDGDCASGVAASRIPKRANRHIRIAMAPEDDV